MKKKTTISETVAKFKSRVELKTGLAVAAQILICKGKVMHGKLCVPNLFMI